MLLATRRTDRCLLSPGGGGELPAVYMTYSSLKHHLIQTHRVDLIDALPTFITLPSDPVAVEVCADPVEDLTRETIVLPLLRVKLQHALVHQILAILDEEKHRGRKR